MDCIPATDRMDCIPADIRPMGDIGPTTGPTADLPTAAALDCGAFGADVSAGHVRADSRFHFRVDSFRLDLHRSKNIAAFSIPIEVC